MKQAMDKINSLVSIVLPTYNGAKYLKEAIASISNQTYVNWQLVIINDCSTDETREICEEARRNDSRIEVYHNEANLKLPASLNRGFERSSGEYLTWTSDDNLYHPNAIEEMVKVLEKSPDTGLVYARCLNIDDNGRVIGIERQLSERFLSTQCIVGACFLYRRQVYDAIGGYDTTLFTAEDYDYWLRVYTYFDIKRLNKVLYSYRIHGQSLTQTRRELCYQMSRKAVEKNLGSLLARRPECVAYALLGYSIREWRAGNYKLSKRFLMKALLLSPGLLWAAGRRVSITAFIGPYLAKKLRIISEKEFSN